MPYDNKKKVRSYATQTDDPQVVPTPRAPFQFQMPPGYANPANRRVASRVDEIVGQYGDDPLAAFDALDSAMRPVGSEEEMRQVWEEGGIPFRTDVPLIEQQEFVPTDTAGMETAIEQLVQARIDATNAGEEGAQGLEAQAKKNLIAQVMSEAVRALAPSSGQSQLPGAMNQFIDSQAGATQAGTLAAQQRAMAGAEGGFDIQQLLFNTGREDQQRREQTQRFNTKAKMDNFINQMKPFQEMAALRQGNMQQKAQLQSQLADRANQWKDWLIKQESQQYDSLFNTQYRQHLRDQSEEAGGGGTANFGRIGAAIEATNVMADSAFNVMQEYEQASKAAESAKAAESFWGIPGVEDDDEEKTRLAQEAKAELETRMSQQIDNIYWKRQDLEQDLEQDIYKAGLGDPDANARIKLFQQYNSLLGEAPAPDAEFEKKKEWLHKFRNRAVRLGVIQPTDASMIPDDFTPTPTAMKEAEDLGLSGDKAKMYAFAKSIPETQKNGLDAPAQGPDYRGRIQGLGATNEKADALLSLDSEEL